MKSIWPSLQGQGAQCELLKLFAPFSLSDTQPCRILYVQGKIPVWHCTVCRYCHPPISVQMVRMGMQENPPR